MASRENIIVRTAAKGNYQNLSWGGSGKQLVFEWRNEDAANARSFVKIGWYDLESAQLSVFDPQEHPDFPRDKTITCTYLKP
jgi:hypothetical protein